MKLWQREESGPNNHICDGAESNAQCCLLPTSASTGAACQAVSQTAEGKSRGRDNERGLTLSPELGRGVRGRRLLNSTWHPGASEPMFPSGGQKAGSERGRELPEHTQRVARGARTGGTCPGSEARRSQQLTDEPSPGA